MDTLQRCKLCVQGGRQHSDVMPGAGTNGAPGIKPMHGLRQILGNQPTFSTTLVSAHTVHPLLVDDALILRLKGAGDRQGSAGGCGGCPILIWCSGDALAALARRSGAHYELTGKRRSERVCENF